MNTPKYLIAPEDCLILLAIRNSQTLREAARLLECDPGGLLRKVQRIADDHGVLQKTNGKWGLTDRGIALVGWAQETILSQKKILLSKTTVRIASTSWLAERLLIPATAALLRQLPENAEVEYSVPDQGLERALIEGDCDFAVACHPPENPLVAHRQIAEEKWVAAAAKNFGKKPMKKHHSPPHLSSLPFIRHHGLNPDTVLPSGQEHERAPISADNLIGVRAALVSGLGWSYVPEVLVRKEIREGELLAFDSELKLGRKICLWWLRDSAGARKRSPLMEGWLRSAL